MWLRGTQRVGRVWDGSRGLEGNRRRAAGEGLYTLDGGRGTSKRSLSSGGRLQAGSGVRGQMRQGLHARSTSPLRPPPRLPIQPSRHRASQLSIPPDQARPRHRLVFSPVLATSEGAHASDGESGEPCDVKTGETKWQHRPGLDALEQSGQHDGDGHLPRRLHTATVMEFSEPLLDICLAPLLLI